MGRNSQIKKDYFSFLFLLTVTATAQPTAIPIVISNATAIPETMPETTALSSELAPKKPRITRAIIRNPIMPIMRDLIYAYYQSVQGCRRTWKDSYSYSVDNPHETTTRLHQGFKKRHSDFTKLLLHFTNKRYNSLN